MRSIKILLATMQKLNVSKSDPIWLDLAYLLARLSNLETFLLICKRKTNGEILSPEQEQVYERMIHDEIDRKSNNSL